MNRSPKLEMVTEENEEEKQPTPLKPVQLFAPKEIEVKVKREHKKITVEDLNLDETDSTMVTGAGLPSIKPGSP